MFTNKLVFNSTKFQINFKRLTLWNQKIFKLECLKKPQKRVKDKSKTKKIVLFSLKIIFKTAKT